MDPPELTLLGDEPICGVRELRPKFGLASSDRRARSEPAALPPPPDERDYLDDDDINAYPAALEAWERACAEVVAADADLEPFDEPHPLGAGVIEATMTALTGVSSMRAGAWEWKLDDAVRARDRRRVAHTPTRRRFLPLPLRGRQLPRRRERRPGCTRRSAASSRSSSSDPGGEGEPAEGRHALDVAEAAADVAARALLIAEDVCRTPASSELLAALWRSPEQAQARFWRARRNAIETREASQRQEVVA